MLFFGATLLDSSVVQPMTLMPATAGYVAQPGSGQVFAFDFRH
jgi:hypothetical protein